MTPCYRQSDLYTLIQSGAWERLTPEQLLVLKHDLVYDFTRRPDQVVPQHNFLDCGIIAGRGWGKSRVWARELTRRVWTGDAKKILLCAQTEADTRGICVRFLIQESPPWFKAFEEYGGVSWPNGAHADVHTAEIAEIRGIGYDHAWCTEIGFWPANTRKACWDNIKTTTREGKRQVFWDTTSKGRVDIVIDRMAANESDPIAHPLIRGTIFDNEIFPASYLRGQWRQYTGRRRDEEMLGTVFAEAQGALWQQAWIDAARVPHLPDGPAVTVVSLDPAVTQGAGADEFGFVVASGIGGHTYIRRDRSARMLPEVWGPMTVDECDRGASGVVIEVTGNSGGDMAPHVIKAHAEPRGYKLRDWPDKMGPFPPRAEGVIYVRQAHARERKEDRADPAAALTERGRVHHVGAHPELESEMTTWTPGSRKSPNRLDAAVRAIIELSGIAVETPLVSPEQAINDAAAATKMINDELNVRARGRAVW